MYHALHLLVAIVATRAPPLKTKIPFVIAFLVGTYNALVCRLEMVSNGNNSTPSKKSQLSLLLSQCHTVAIPLLSLLGVSPVVPPIV